MKSNSVCNQTSDNKSGQPRNIPICLSRVWLQTELDNMKSYYQLIKENYNFQEKKNTKVRKGKIYIKSFYTVSMVIETKVVIGWFKLQLWMGLAYWTVQ